MLPCKIECNYSILIGFSNFENNRSTTVRPTPKLYVCQTPNKNIVERRSAVSYTLFLQGDNAVVKTTQVIYSL